MKRLNDLLDALPCAYFRFGDHFVPSYFALGLTGVIVGTIVLIALAQLVPASVTVTLALAIISSGALIMAALVRKRLTGTEEHVLLEDFFAVLCVDAILLAAVGLAVLSYLDLVAVGVAFFLTFGRLGCLVSGCCYGKPCSIGLCYPAECGHQDNLVRRFPVQLVESVVWLGLALTASVFVVLAQAGAALSFILIGYGLVRSFLELLRDDSRSRIFGASEASWLSLVAIGIGIVLADGRSLLAFPEVVLLTIGSAVAGLLVLARRRWMAGTITIGDPQRSALTQIGHAIADDPPSEEVAVWRVFDYTVGASVAGDQTDISLCLSVCREGARLSQTEATWVLNELAHATGSSGPKIDVIEQRSGLFVGFYNWIDGMNVNPAQILSVSVSE